MQSEHCRYSITFPSSGFLVTNLTINHLKQWREEVTNMNIIPWKRTAEKEETTELARTFTDLQREINCLFEDFFGEALLEVPTAGFAPTVDVTETDHDILVKADLPGLTDKDIEVTLEDGALILKGEKKEEKKDERTGVYRIERSYGTFYRRLMLPVEVETEKVEATFDKGVLEIKLPKREVAKPVGIKVNVKAA
jgi:HSP20 family protein